MTETAFDAQVPAQAEKQAIKAAAKAKAAAAAYVGNIVAYTDRSGHTYPALVTIDSTTFDASKAGTGYRSPQGPYGKTTVSLRVFRPNLADYARHDVPFKRNAKAGQRSWKPLA